MGGGQGIPEGTMDKCARENTGTVHFVAMRLIPVVCENPWKNKNNHSLKTLAELTDPSDEALVYTFLASYMDTWKWEIERELEKEKTGNKVVARNNMATKENTKKEEQECKSRRDMFDQFDDDVLQRREKDDTWDEMLMEEIKEAEALKTEDEVKEKRDGVSVCLKKFKKIRTIPV